MQSAAAGSAELKDDHGLVAAAGEPDAAGAARVPGRDARPPKRAPLHAVPWTRSRRGGRRRSAASSNCRRRQAQGLRATTISAAASGHSIPATRRPWPTLLSHRSSCMRPRSRSHRGAGVSLMEGGHLTPVALGSGRFALAGFSPVRTSAPSTAPPISAADARPTAIAFEPTAWNTPRRALEVPARRLI